MAVLSQKIDLKQRQLFLSRQFDMFHNLNRSKTAFGKNFVILKDHSIKA